MLTPSAASHRQTIATKFVPPLLKPILADYQRNIPAAREAEVLQLMAVIVTRLRSEVAGEVPSIMEALFECTLAMVKVNYTYVLLRCCSLLLSVLTV